MIQLVRIVNDSKTFNVNEWKFNIFLSALDCWESMVQGRPLPSRCWQETLALQMAQLRSVTLTGTFLSPFKSYIWLLTIFFWCILLDICVGFHCMFINLPGLCPQEDGWHHRLQERGHKHWLLPPGGRTGWPPDWRRTSLFLLPHQGHLQEGDWPGKVTAITTSILFWQRPVSYQSDLQTLIQCLFSVVMIPLCMVVTLFAKIPVFSTSFKSSKVWGQ